MKLYVDLETLQAIVGPGQRAPISCLRVKRGDLVRLDVSFLQNGLTPTAIGDPATMELHFGAKPRGTYGAGYLVYSDAWTMPAAEEVKPVYRCDVSFNTAELAAAFISPTGMELADIAIMGEITWLDGTGQTSTRTFQVTVENDVNRGDEGTPVALPTPDEWLDSRAVRFDKAQLLSPDEQERVRTAIGVTVIEGPPGPPGADSTVPGPQGEPGDTGPQGPNAVNSSTSSDGTANLVVAGIAIGGQPAATQSFTAAMAVALA